MRRRKVLLETDILREIIKTYFIIGIKFLKLISIFTVFEKYFFNSSFGVSQINLTPTVLLLLIEGDCDETNSLPDVPFVFFLELLLFSFLCFFRWSKSLLLLLLLTMPYDALLGISSIACA